MAIYSRQFVTQKLGRGVGTVQAVVLDDKYSVLITFGIATIEPEAFTFEVDQLRQPTVVYPLEELVLRTAIARLHKWGVGHVAATPRPELLPWIGDFTDARFGGTTASYAHMTTAMTDRRNGGKLLEASVECGVQLRVAQGRLAAKSFMQSALIPPSVIRRVLSNSLARRKKHILPDGKQ